MTVRFDSRVPVVIDQTSCVQNIIMKANMILVSDTLLPRGFEVRKVSWQQVK